MTIGDRIKKIREHFEITSNEFAELTGIHPVTIRKYETNKMQPSKEHIDKMCESLRLPRMIFEGIPEQYTDLHFRGDLYQVVLSLMASGILSLSTEFSENGNIYTKPSEELADLIDFTVDGNTIPLDKIKIEFKPSNSLLLPNNDDFLPYIGFVKAIPKHEFDEIEHGSSDWSKNGEQYQILQRGVRPCNKKDRRSVWRVSPPARWTRKILSQTVVSSYASASFTRVS